MSADRQGMAKHVKTLEKEIDELRVNIAENCVVIAKIKKELDPDRTPFEEGLDAFRAFAAVVDSPYTPGSNEDLEWLEGYRACL